MRIFKPQKKVPYRLLEEVPELSYGDKESGNMLIQGDNLEALKALFPSMLDRLNVSTLTHLTIQNPGPSWKTQNFFSGEFSPQVEKCFF
jgi:hypothetical protein